MTIDIQRFECYAIITFKALNVIKNLEDTIMPTIRFALSDEYYARLESDAQNTNMNVQDYIRFRLFNETTIFTVDEAVQRIKNGSHF